MEIKISDAELEVMRILWREKRPLKVSEFRGELEVNKGWNKSTTHTIVTRLRDKGLIEPAILPLETQKLLYHPISSSILTNKLRIYNTAGFITISQNLCGAILERLDENMFDPLRGDPRFEEVRRRLGENATPPDSYYEEFTQCYSRKITEHVYSGNAGDDS